MEKEDDKSKTVKLFLIADFYFTNPQNDDQESLRIKLSNARKENKFKTENSKVANKKKKRKNEFNSVKKFYAMSSNSCFKR